ncbi:MAG: phosphoribosylamine--glycine ligase [Marine Group III euryarchaeote CG-Epi4]|uniref:phosphoribosylamine--glycine ligase n=1 Tax=Marine Group III euryarchaeote CG-Epi4 TaxID=1888998 RepID=A0A1J5TYP9_9ARCH|nr:MAG: phosphoribosylamine--glycine ligase [Marine Group III euryarchaeote CG-Epi4]
MNFLVIGSGAREHIIAQKLFEAGVDVFSVITNRNPGLISLSKEFLFVNTYKDNIQRIIDFSLSRDIACVVIGPEDPLALGFSDSFLSKGIPVVGPTRLLAQVETSKGFTRDLLSRNEIHVSPRYERFNSIKGVEDFINDLSEEYVIKYDGLMGGKGVKVSGEHLLSMQEAITYCSQLIELGGSFIVEEKLLGEEFSLMSFCDGNTVKHMPAVQDHKRAYDGDIGPNTGGMGCYTDLDHSLPFLKGSELSEAREINERVSTALKKEYNEGYKGILYGGFMATREGIKLIEYNARFGDPEAMNLLTLLDTDFASVCMSMANGNLVDVKFKSEASVCKYVVPKGYGSNPANDATLIVDDSYKEYSDLYYAAVNVNDSGYITTTSSRAAAIVSTGADIKTAESSCEAGLSHISGNNIFVRHDIAKPHLIEKRIQNMESIR